ncbi:hypothetical protein AZE42_06550 [Rhizopogon vesiculosus]|uniref:DH domain-containing protein n=1 Tax=Rhizopogon vesiculosus TaxID=180088 RepID=A0A1J8Q3Z9_9AGAM|nr:hypothetical protein AZE42_06550 [Rhizopogon vesiculosus]
MPRVAARTTRVIRLLAPVDKLVESSIWILYPSRTYTIIIYKTITQEEQYVQDLDTVEALFILPLLKANPPVMPAAKLDEFIREVFGNILDLRGCNRRLVEAMYVRQREQAPIIERTGDIFIDAAVTFRLAYPTYVGHLPLAEKRLKNEIESNANLRLFLEV